MSKIADATICAHSIDDCPSDPLQRKPSSLFQEAPHGDSADVAGGSHIKAGAELAVARAGAQAVGVVPLRHTPALGQVVLQRLLQGGKALASMDQRNVRPARELLAEVEQPVLLQSNII